jgi:L-2-hydroxyglutarate oxidase LhgO
MALAAVIGGGVVGIAAARMLAKEYETFLFEKKVVGEAQSGHNSGVNHPGIIHDVQHEPLKAFHCVRGNRMNWQYIMSKAGSAYDIPFRADGELIVARTEDEWDGLCYMKEKADSRSISAAFLAPDAVLAREPGINCYRGLWVPSSGVFDQVMFLKALRVDAELSGATIFEHTEVKAVAPVAGGFRIVTSNDDFVADVLVNAAGLYADRIAQQCGVDAPTIYPYRGEYVTIHPSAGIVNNLVYFPPEPGGLGHGMHFMRTPSGQVMYGPSIEYDASDRAKEDYANRETIVVRGMQRQTLEYFFEEARRAFPKLRIDQLSPDIVGIRAKLRPPGSNDPSDFYIQPQLHGNARAYHVIADSPGLTACLSIAQEIADGLSLPLPEFAGLTGSRTPISR